MIKTIKITGRRHYRGNNGNWILLETEHEFLEHCFIEEMAPGVADRELIIAHVLELADKHPGIPIHSELRSLKLKIEKDI